MIPHSIASYLRYPLYKLYYLHDIEGYNGMSPEDVAAFRRDYDSDIRQGIVDALRWVGENPDADLTEVLPKLPCSNEAIHTYAGKILRSLEAGV